MKASPNQGKRDVRQVGKIVAVVNKTIVVKRLLNFRPAIYN